MNSPQRQKRHDAPGQADATLPSPDRREVRTNLPSLPSLASLSALPLPSVGPAPRPRSSVAVLPLALMAVDLAVAWRGGVGPTHRNHAVLAILEERPPPPLICSTPMRPMRQAARVEVRRGALC